MNWQINFLSNFEERLEFFLTENVSDQAFAEALKYQFFPAGKRIRPLLMSAFSHDCIVNNADTDSLNCLTDLACSLEILHTASLIHDDLPGIDNDTERRGRPTLHVRIGEGRAILAGDFLIARALSIASSVASRVKQPLLTKIFAESFCQLSFGQDLDIRNCSNNPEQSLLLYDLKTGALFQAAFESVRLINFGESLFYDETRLLAQTFGRAFQALNDFKDISTEEVHQRSERSSNSDDRNSRPTLISLLPSSDLQDYIRSLKEQTLNRLSILEDNIEQHYRKAEFSLSHLRQIIEPLMNSLSPL